MKEFLFKSPTLIKFGVNSSKELYSICSEFHSTKVMFVTGKHILSSVEFNEILESFQASGIDYKIFSEITNEPTVSMIDSAALALRESECTSVIAIGGGSVIDSAKAISMLATNNGSAKDYMFGGNGTITSNPLPLICVPTTAGSGSEVTASSVILDEERQVKLSITHNSLFPKYAVIDPMLQLSMPHKITISTGMDALTHAIEAYTSRTATLLSDMYALTAIRILGKNIKEVSTNPDNIEARSEMAIGSSLAALSFVNGGLGAVHGISQSMGGIAHVPHGIGNAILLPYIMEINHKGNPQKFAVIARELGLDCSNLSVDEAALSAVKKIQEISDEIGIPKSTKDVGVTKSMFSTIVEETMAYRLLKCNPVEITPEIIYEILNKSF